jgi:hypothetical protein
MPTVGKDRPSVEAWPGEADEDGVQLWISDEEKKRHGLMPRMKIPDEVVEKIRLENGMPPLATPSPRSTRMTSSCSPGYPPGCSGQAEAAR